MIRRIEALHYRCLRYVNQRLGTFQVLVGPNSSGKSTFLDTISFMGDLITGDLDKAIENRTQNFEDLLWRKKGEKFELAIELTIPEKLCGKLAKKTFEIVRYEISIGYDEGGTDLGILSEKVSLIEPIYDDHSSAYLQEELFPFEKIVPPTIITSTYLKNTKTVVNKVKDGNSNFYCETGIGYDPSFKLGKNKSAVRNLPEDESKFPVTVWLKELLSDGVQRINLDTQAMRKPSPRHKKSGYQPNGANLPWLIEELINKHEDKYLDWLSHLQTALPQIKKIKTVEREEDRHRYIVICYKNDLELPSWTISDGTLRILALTLPAYIPNLNSIFLIEEPENGIHPKAVESLCASLSSIYDSQVLIASHSPVILNVTKPEQLLCFSKTPNDIIDIISGNNHPALRHWQHETDLGTLFAGGVLE